MQSGENDKKNGYLFDLTFSFFMNKHDIEFVMQIHILLSNDEPINIYKKNKSQNYHILPLSFLFEVVDLFSKLLIRLIQKNYTQTKLNLNDKTNNKKNFNKTSDSSFLKVNRVK